MGTGFTVNAHRFDPYKNFKFRVEWDNRIVAGISKVGALKRTTEVVKHRHGGENSHDRKSPGRTTYEAITLERGLTHDPEFEAWANKVHHVGGDTLMDLAGYKKEVAIILMNEKGQPVYRYNVHNAWVSEFTSLADLDGNANAVLIESLKLDHEGWERDLAVTEPDESA